LAEDYYETGLILLARGEEAQTLDACRAALEIRPDYPEPVFLRARVLLRLGKLPEAALACDQYLRRGTPTADAFRTRAEIRQALGQYAGAALDVTRSLELKEDPALYTLRGWSYLLLGAPAPALADFDAALASRPDDLDARTGRAFARVRLGHYRDAVADAEEVARRGPRSPEMWYNLACVHALAVARVEAAASAPDREALARRGRDRAVELIRSALEALPAARRAAFWTGTIRGDADLESLRGDPGFQRIEHDYVPGTE
ncbi:MAG TPA: tetratricopeptide repeat protein, partial [Isosphaeraceae bacterium]